ncbi:MAG: transcriptional regulator, MarR family [Desulfacinum sp.]|jgi:DNA-binding MarR family transcriptional regulator|nr:transcriptional regulator, MarR family [Desulfacinum sp.]
MPQKPEDCIFFQLAKAAQAGVRYWTSRISHLNVTAVQGLVLAFLADEDRVTSARLGQRVQLDSATLTGILDRLERLGFVERRKNPHDRRSILICLTDEGKRVAREIIRISREANASFLKEISQEEEALFRSLLVRLAQGG